MTRPPYERHLRDPSAHVSIPLLASPIRHDGAPMKFRGHRRIARLRTRSPAPRPDPAQRHRPIGQPILHPRGLAVILHLGRGGLAHVELHSFYAWATRAGGPTAAELQDAYAIEAAREGVNCR